MTGAQDQNVDEILASIRRILADEDETTAPAQPTKPEAKPTPAETETLSRSVSNVLQLTKILNKDGTVTDLDASDAKAADEGLEGESVAEEVSAADLEPEAAQPETEQPEEPEASVDLGPVEARDAGLLDSTTEQAIGRAVAELAGAIKGPDAAISKRLEDRVEQELRPLIKAWLDQHLPDMVRDIVAAEIQRVVVGKTPPDR